MAELLDDSVLDQLFRDARSHNAWASQSFGEADMRAIYALARMGPTSVNSSPARFVWVASPEAKDRLAACASTDNAAKIRAAPVTVIVAYDLDFAEKLPQLMPKKPDVKKLFANPEIAQVTAFRNGTLQGGYLILAARAAGYDCGPMSGFNNALVDQAFFAGTGVRSNFLCSIGKATDQPPARPPRLEFEEASRIV